jgi:DNA-binding transcriptional LysR family regulator
VDIAAFRSTRRVDLGTLLACVVDASQTGAQLSATEPAKTRPKPIDSEPARRATPPLNLRHVEYFLVLAEELHFGRAATRLRIGQPPLSQQIRRLERDLNVRLLRRDRRHVELTPAGQAFRDDALLLISQADQARRSAQRAGRGEIGKLLVGFVPSGNHALLMDLMVRMRDRCPDVEIVLRSMSTSAQLDGILAGQIDVGFVRMPLQHPSLAVRVVAAERLVVALPADHPLAAQPDVAIDQLADQGLIIFPRAIAPSYYDFILSLFHQLGHQPRIAQEIEHLPTILALVGHRLGFTLLPSSNQDFSYRQVVYRPLRDDVPPVETGVVTRPDRQAGLLATFLDLMPE